MRGNKMKIRIKRIDKELPLPVYKTPGAACVDLYARVETIIPARGIGYVPMNIAVALPDHCVGLVFARSSTHKRGLMLGNSVGVLDSDFCGDNDELQCITFNFTDADIVVERGFRLCQFMVLQYDHIEFEEVERLSEIDRGGIGSTGNY